MACSRPWGTRSLITLEDRRVNAVQHPDWRPERTATWRERVASVLVGCHAVAQGKASNACPRRETRRCGFAITCCTAACLPIRSLESWLRGAQAFQTRYFSQSAASETDYRPAEEWAQSGQAPFHAGVISAQVKSANSKADPLLPAVGSNVSHSNF